jgi:hypothetical protein
LNVLAKLGDDGLEGLCIRSTFAANRMATLP